MGVPSVAYVFGFSTSPELGLVQLLLLLSLYEYNDG
jgi:hypothetical protein